MVVTVDIPPTQGPAPSGSFVVKVSITVPLAIDGVYPDVSEFALEKLPDGALHVPLVALPPTVPAKVILPPAHAA